MKRPRTHLVTASSSRALGRGMSKSDRTKALCPPKPGSLLTESKDHCYRTLLEVSSSVILLLSPESIILEWSRTAETVSGWIADEALGRSYVELCLPIEARESFLTELARVTEGSDVKGLEFPFRVRTGSETMFSWNITRVLGAHGGLIGLMAIGTAVIPGTQAEKELRLAHARLRSEALRAQRAVEEERRRIARELHDEFGQALTGLKFDLAWLGRTLAQSPAPTGGEALLNKVHAMSGSVDALLESVRATAAALRPAMLDDLGLVPALECLATRLQDCTGARCAIDVAPGLASIALPSEASTALFRIAQELLTNVMRHAAASLVHMRLYQDGSRVTLEVTDNGKGITRERMATLRSFGLRGMQERAALLGGHVHIVGTSGVGTRAIVSVPVGGCVAL
ncbi:MAG: PAS domain S-box protein [Nitrospirae bacterium]|nr:PAS domain S-box protein [Nitrospirota bacterium]